mmetsp:Transcript_47526/g.91909  ORF Transcript_47526/g.91909 Transcript_47526/m.91909 type:complete len:321 (+) Transcript_47526:43-1005(+)
MKFGCRSHLRGAAGLLALSVLTLSTVQAVRPPAHASHPWYPYSARHWATDVHNAHNVCQHGTVQSPINFAQCAVPISRSPAEISWAKQKVVLVNNGHTVQITAANSGASRGKMVIDGKSYTLVQCHWHYASEHTVDEIQYPLELHCVHQLDGTDEAPLYGVFAMLYELSDSPNLFLSRFEDQLPHCNQRRGTKPCLNISSFKGPLDFNDIYKGVDLHHFWNYEGSFTIPPCLEAVTFYMMMDKAPITQAQLDGLKEAIGWEGVGGNFRPPQPLQGRTVSGCRSVAKPVPQQTSKEENSRSTAVSSFLLSPFLYLASCIDL